MNVKSHFGDEKKEFYLTQCAIRTTDVSITHIRAKRNIWTNHLTSTQLPGEEVHI